MEPVVLLLVGGAGAVLGARIGIPNGALLGSVAAVVLHKLVGGDQGESVQSISIAGQLLIGAAIGSSIDRRLLAQFRTIVVPGLVAVAGMLASGVLVGLLLIAFTDLPAAAALFGAMPGGSTQMAAASLAFGSDGATVVAMHLIRTVTIIALLPMVLSLILRRLSTTNGRTDGVSTAEVDAAARSGGGSHR